MQFKRSLFVMTLAALGVVSSNAGTISLQTTPAGATAIPSLVGATVINFDSTAPGTYSSLTISGVTFTADTGNLIWIDNAFIGSYNNFGTQSLHNNYDPQSFNTLTMNFASTVSAFGFFWGASDSTWTLSAYNSSHTLIESFALPTTFSSNAGDFVGLFDAGIASATLSGVGSDYIFMDNFAFNAGTSTATPEPASILLVAGGLAAVLFRRRLSR